MNVKRRLPGTAICVYQPVISRLDRWSKELICTCVDGVRLASVPVCSIRAVLNSQRASDIRKCQRALTDKANQAEADALSALEPLQSQDWRRKPQGKFKAVSQRH